MFGKRPCLKALLPAIPSGTDGSPIVVVVVVVGVLTLVLQAGRIEIFVGRAPGIRAPVELRCFKCSLGLGI